MKTVTYTLKFQTQPLEVFCKKRRSWKFCKFHKRPPALVSLFNKVAGLMVFSCEFTKCLRAPILKNIYEWLFLKFCKPFQAIFLSLSISSSNLKQLCYEYPLKTWSFLTFSGATEIKFRREIGLKISEQLQS